MGVRKSTNLLKDDRQQSKSSQWINQCKTHAFGYLVNLNECCLQFKWKRKQISLNSCGKGERFTPEIQKYNRMCVCHSSSPKTYHVLENDPRFVKSRSFFGISWKRISSKSSSRMKSIIRPIHTVKLELNLWIWKILLTFLSFKWFKCFYLLIRKCDSFKISWTWS